jgi:hypothetical protein
MPIDLSHAGMALDNEKVDGIQIPEAKNKLECLSRSFMVAGCKHLIVYSTPQGGVIVRV